MRNLLITKENGGGIGIRTLDRLQTYASFQDCLEKSSFYINQQLTSLFRSLFNQKSVQTRSYTGNNHLKPCKSRAMTIKEIK